MPTQPRPALYIAIASTAIALAATTGSVVGGRLELRVQQRQLSVDIGLRTQLLSSEIERHRLLPTTLASNPELAIAVDSSTPVARRLATIRRLNDEFERLAKADGSATLYLIDAAGITRVASNHRLATSFIGQDYSFRPYFRDAIARGSGQLFAQGTVSGLPGLYLAQKLAGGDGVIVTKVEFVGLENSWRMPDDETLVVDRAGLVLLTSNPARRFTRYDTKPAVSADRIAAHRRATADWTLILLRDIDKPMLLARVAGGVIGGLLGLLASLALAYARTIRWRRQLQREELERLVAQRTSELQTSNLKLVHEIEERARSESKAQKLREDLAQSNRLAILGQISAGVAHEINQPAAAIRAYVDNVRKFLRSDNVTQAVATLATIDSLTDRIGLITNELREFSRRAPTSKEVVRLSDVIDGARLLMDPQLRTRRILMRRSTMTEPECVHANRTRLEQVVVNLLQNAMDALNGTPSPEIRVETGSDGTGVWLSVTDNGPGVPVDRRADLFAPFSSTKPLGLGLGLVICRDIVADYGGSIEFRPGSPTGASFIVRLPTWAL